MTHKLLLIRLLINKNPKQLKFKFALWAKEAVRTLIKEELSVDMPIFTVGYYLNSWQFTSKKPIKRVYERRYSDTKRWLNKEYLKIKKEPKKQKASIWWCDETQSLPNNLKGYALIRAHNKPALNHITKRFKINMISAITNTGKSLFALYDENMNVDRFIDFLKKVINLNKNKNKIFMIVDNLRVHHTKLAKSWEEDNKTKIKLFCLPAYSPDLNPDKYLKQDFKQSVNKNDIPINKEHLRRNTNKYMKSLEANSTEIANFFKRPKVKYAS